MLARVASAHSSFRRKGIPTRTKLRSAIAVRARKRLRGSKSPTVIPLFSFSAPPVGPSRARWRPRAPARRGGRETSARLADERGVALDDDALEAARRATRSPRGPPRDRRPVEEAAGVVELHVRAGGQPLERESDLRGDRALRRRRLERVLPEVAHQAAARALPVRQEDRRDRRPFRPPRAASSSTKKPYGRRGSTAFSRRRQAGIASRARGRRGSRSRGAAYPRGTRRYCASVREALRGSVLLHRPRAGSGASGRRASSRPVTALTPRATISPLSA